MTILAAALLLAAVAASAPAATGGAPTPAGGGPVRASPRGAPASDGASAGALQLVSAHTSPRRSFYYGVRHPRLRFAIASSQAHNDLRIDVVDAAGEAVTSFYRNDVEPLVENTIHWDGATSEGRPARNGRYRFRIVPQAGGPPVRPLKRLIKQRRARRRASRSAAPPPFSLGFKIYGYAFPVLGTHNYGQAGARFGAGRGGRTHQGQDVMARCGTPLVAARGGRVRYSGYQGAAGNYLVIDGRGTGFDMAYMHMLRPSPLKKGMIVRTGQPIGLVGSTGSSTACHLHFEIWTAPGWYEGGSPIDPIDLLQRWDRYS